MTPSAASSVGKATRTRPSTTGAPSTPSSTEPRPRGCRLEQETASTPQPVAAVAALRQSRQNSLPSGSVITM